MAPKHIYLTRHGQSKYNVQGKIGGNSQLTLTGENYARKFASKMESLVNIEIWTSSLARTIATAKYFAENIPKYTVGNLDEISAGEFDGMTYDEISRKFPEEYKKRSLDKWAYRYPKGESYKCVVQRLRPILTKLHTSEKDICIVAHQAVIRMLLALLLNKKCDEYVNFELPSNSFFVLQYRQDDKYELVKIEKVLN